MGRQGPPVPKKALRCLPPKLSSSFYSHRPWDWFVFQECRCPRISRSLRKMPKLCRTTQRATLILIRFSPTLPRQLLRTGWILQLSLTLILGSATPSLASLSMALPICSTGTSGACRRSTEQETPASPSREPRSDSQPTLEWMLQQPTTTPLQSSWALGFLLGSPQISQTLESTLMPRWTSPMEADSS